MNLVAELKAEREGLIEDTRRMIERLAAEAKHSVEHVGQCAPVVVAIDGCAPQFYYPSWSSEYQKLAAFKGLRGVLAERNLSATVVVIPSAVDYSDGSKKRAVVITAHTHDWKEMLIMPFQIGEGFEVVWDKPVVRDKFKSNLLEMPYGLAD